MSVKFGVAAVVVALSASPSGPVAAQAASNPFVGHWTGAKHCESGDAPLALDIVADDNGVLALTMRAGGIGTLTEGAITGDAITMTWSNFLSRVVFKGRFVSAQRIEGTYHESMTGTDCTWSAENDAAPQTSVPTPSAAAPASAPVSSAPLAAATPPPVPKAQTELDLWKLHADEDRQKLARHLSPTARDDAISQFCQFSPDQADCAAQFGKAYDFLVQSAFATLTIASKNRAVPLPPSAPANGLPSYYDVYEVYMFLTRDSAP